MKVKHWFNQNSFSHVFAGIWKVLSKSTSRKEGFIHRLTTKDIESIHKQDFQNERSTPRTFICMKDIEAFELIFRNHGED